MPKWLFSALGRGLRGSGVVLVLVAASVPARATCGTTACFLVTQTSDGTTSRGSLTVDLSYQFVDQSRLLSGSHEVSEVLVPKVSFEDGELELDHHREIRTQGTYVKLDLVYGVTDRLSLTSSIPLWNDEDHEHFDEAGTPDEHFTRDDGTRGFGDVRVGVRYALVVRLESLLVGSFAVKVPTGAYRLLDSEGTINEPTIQPGTGSTDFLASFYYTRSGLPGRLEGFTSATYRVNGENSLDYEMGNETTVTVGASRPLGAHANWSLQANARRTERDHFLGMSVPSTGATYVSLTPGLRFRNASGATLYGLVQFPVHQRVNEEQLAPRTGVQLGVSRTF